MTVASSLLLPMPVAVAVPQALTLSEDVLGVGSLPVTGVGDPARSHRAGPTERGRHGRRGAEGPSASVTRVGKVAKSRRQARAEASAIAANGIPAAALRAYRTAEATMNIADPSCGLSWGLLAGIGRVESDHGRYGGATLADNGVSTPHILGLELNGTGATAAIADTDHGTLDGDTHWDRAVGPMQFIPSTWAIVGVDGDGDGIRNPHDIDDAALAAAAYLCAGGDDLTTPTGLHDAVYSYNHSNDYVAMVLALAHAYQSGMVDLPLLQATLNLPTGPGTTVDLTTGHGIAIGATDDVSGLPGEKAKQAKKTKKAEQTKPGATGSKEQTKSDTKADPRAGSNPADKTQQPTGGMGQQKPPAGGAGGGDKPTDPGTPTPTPTPPATGDKGGSGDNGGTDPVKNPPTTEPPTTEPPTTEPPTTEPPTTEPPTTEPPTTEPPTTDPETDLGQLVSCEEAPSGYCLESTEGGTIALLDVPGLSEEWVDNDTFQVTVVYVPGSDDGSPVDVVQDLTAAKLD